MGALYVQMQTSPDVKDLRSWDQYCVRTLGFWHFLLCQLLPPQAPQYLRTLGSWNLSLC